MQGLQDVSKLSLADGHAPTLFIFGTPIGVNHGAVGVYAVINVNSRAVRVFITTEKVGNVRLNVEDHSVNAVELESLSLLFEWGEAGGRREGGLAR